MPRPIFDETHSVIQRPTSHWPRIGRWAADIGAAVFPWAFLTVALLRLPFLKAENPSAVGLWGDVRWILGLQFLLGLVLFAAIGKVAPTVLGTDTSAAERIGAWTALAAYGVAFSYWLWTVVAMFRRSRHFLLHYVLQWLIIAAAVTVDFGVYAWLEDLHMNEIRSLIDFDMKTKIVGSIVLGGSGVWFLLTSRQSKNTFVR